MYLGYNYEQDIATLASKLTLHANKEIKFNFFSTIKSNYKDDIRSIEYGLRGFCISRHSVKELPLAIIEEAIKDMECIFINKRHLPHEILLTIAANDKVMNHWYKMMWEGDVANKICKNFNYFDGPYDEDAVPVYRAKIREEMKDQLLTVDNEEWVQERGYDEEQYRIKQRWEDENPPEDDKEMNSDTIGDYPFEADDLNKEWKSSKPIGNIERAFRNNAIDQMDNGEF